jgi:hypothetical protein
MFKYVILAISLAHMPIQSYDLLYVRDVNQRSSVVLNDITASSIPSRSIIDYELLEKLFIVNNSREYSLHKKLSAYLETQSGFSVSKKLISSPTSNKNHIFMRQNAIKLLTRDYELYTKIRTALWDIARHENSFLKIWLNPVSNWSEYQRTLMPINGLQQYNQNATVLGLNYWYKRFSMVTAPLLAQLSMSCFMGTVEKTKEAQKMSLRTVWDGLKFGAQEFLRENKKVYSVFVSPTAAQEFYKANIEAAGNNKIMGTLLSGVRLSQTITTPYYIASMHKLLSSSKADLVQHLRSELTHAAQLLDQVSSLYQLCASTPALSHMHCLDAVKSAAQDIEKFRKLYRETQKSTIWSYFCDNANLVAAYTCLESIKPALLAIYEFIGELDTYMGIATLIKTHASKTTEPYCFVEWSTAQKPELALTGFWNPLIENNSVVNSIRLSNNNEHALLEGPHACGKSTITRAIAYNFTLIHTFGIAAAQQATSSIFDCFISYANITEDPILRLSGFDAQLREIIKLRETIQLHVAQGRRVFCFLDEPLTGTMEEAGAQELRVFCDFVAQQDNLVCLLATHFNNVTRPSQFKPHYMACDEAELAGNFLRKYLVVNGKHPWWYQDENKRTRYITWMRAQARKQLGYGA